MAILEHAGGFLKNKNSRSALIFWTIGYISPLERYPTLPFMRKCLPLALLLLAVTTIGARAQSNLFELETDTVCVGQSVRIRPLAMNASSYYWGFCSGYLNT